MKNMIRVLACVLVLLMAGSGMALAEVSMSGILQPADVNVITAPMSGSVISCEARTVDKLSEGDALIVVDTVRIYAPCTGTVAAVRAEEGDSVSAVAALYGAVMYVEPASRYVISASTTNAYDSNDNHIIHVGETVYLTSINNSSRTGVGLITYVEGENYNVEVLESNIRLNETCRISRDKDSGKTSAVIGQGKTKRNNPMAVVADGSVVKLHVEEGDEVVMGDLLMEVAPDRLDGATESTLEAEYDCIVLNMLATEGGAVQKGQPIAQVFETGTLQAVVYVSEDDLLDIEVGDQVTVTLDIDPDEYSYKGNIEWISYVPTESAMGMMYEVTVSFKNDDVVRMGMSVTVETKD